jgi:hypothetical protein
LTPEGTATPASLLDRRRARLPDRRAAVTTTITWPPDRGRRIHVTAGFGPDGRLLEVFLSSAGQVGSDSDFLLDDAAVALSRLLQHGDDVEAIAAGLGRVERGRPASVIGAVVATLAWIAAGAAAPS